MCTVTIRLRCPKRGGVKELITITIHLNVLSVKNGRGGRNIRWPGSAGIFSTIQQFKTFFLQQTFEIFQICQFSIIVEKNLNLG